MPCGVAHGPRHGAGLGRRRGVRPRVPGPRRAERQRCRHDRARSPRGRSLQHELRPRERARVRDDSVRAHAEPLLEQRAVDARGSPRSWRRLPRLSRLREAREAPRPVCPLAWDPITKPAPGGAVVGAAEPFSCGRRPNSLQTCTSTRSARPRRLEIALEGEQRVADLLQVRRQRRELVGVRVIAARLDARPRLQRQSSLRAAREPGQPRPKEVFG